MIPIIVTAVIILTIALAVAVIAETWLGEKRRR